MLLNPSDSVTLVRSSQAQNAAGSIAVTLLGIVMLVKPHSSKALSPISVTPFGIVMLVKAKQW